MRISTRAASAAASLALAAVALGVAQQAEAWGATGHRLVGIVAIRALPDDLPKFVRTNKVAAAVGELAREPDRTKGSGKLHDEQREGNHFVDLDDAGRVMGGPHIDALPPTRQQYDDALRAAGSDLTKAGWLPYSMAGGYNQLVTDFALWRVAKVGEKTASSRERRRWYKADRIRREHIILRDIGEFAHWVGDGAQPLHTSIHYNGWGDYPNPKGYTTSRGTHSAVDGGIVYGRVTEHDVARQLTPYRPCTDGIERCVAAYIKTSWGYIDALYALEKAGGFAPGDPRGGAFAAERLAAGSSQLRDFIVDAWRASATAQVGWPKVSVADVEAGKADPWDSLYGKD